MQNAFQTDLDTVAKIDKAKVGFPPAPMCSPTACVRRYAIASSRLQATDEVSVQSRHQALRHRHCETLKRWYYSLPPLHHTRSTMQAGTECHPRNLVACLTRGWSLSPLPKDHLVVIGCDEQYLVSAPAGAWRHPSHLARSRAAWRRHQHRRRHHRQAEAAQRQLRVMFVLLIKSNQLKF